MDAVTETERRAADYARAAIRDPDHAYLLDYYRDGDEQRVVSWLAGVVSTNMRLDGHEFPDHDRLCAIIRDVVHSAAYTS